MSVPSIKDVAEHAGVSISTVSNALRGTKFVSEDLKKRIEASIKELGYEVNPIASSLKSKSTRVIGIVITNIHRIFFPRVIRGIQDHFSDSGYQLTFYDTDDNLDKEKHIVNLLKRNWVDGIILDSVADENDIDYFADLAGLKTRGKNIPIVSLERRLHRSGIDSVVVDNREGGRLATRHLLECGCKRVVFMAGPMNSCMVHDRMRGCRDEIQAAGLGEKPHILHADFSPRSGYEQMAAMVESGEPFDAVFAANDQMAIGALKALKERDIDVPGQVKLIGFDNTFVSSIVEPSLTTVHVPKYQMGVNAAELLLERIKTPTASPKLIEHPVEMIKRQSSDPAGEHEWDLYDW